MNANELERKLCAVLDALALNPKLRPASRAAGASRTFVHEAIKKSEAGDPLYLIRWHDDNFRQFCELVPLAQRAGIVKRDQDLRGVTIDGEQQFVKDPALLARFGEDDDSTMMAELAGFPQFPFALDVDGNKIPLLSARHPRPQRQHRNSPPCAVSEQSSGANGEQQHAAGMPEVGKHGLPKYESEWTPEPPPPYARGLKTPAPPPRVFVPTPASPRVAADSPLRAELMERLKNLKEHGPANPRAVDRNGRATMPARIIGQRADDPAEHVG